MLMRHSGTTIKLNKIFGPMITDLLNGMLEPIQTHRYTITKVLEHPAFAVRQ